MLTTKNFGSDEKEKNVDQIKCTTMLNQLFKTLEECCISEKEEVKKAFVKLQAEIKKAIQE